MFISDSVACHQVVMARQLWVIGLVALSGVWLRDEELEISASLRVSTALERTFVSAFTCLVDVSGKSFRSVMPNYIKGNSEKIYKLQINL